MRADWKSFWLMAVLFFLTNSGSATTPGTVYISMGSDTAIWNAPGGIDVPKFHGHFSPDLYTNPSRNAYKVMDPAFRAQFVDSYGQQLKLTWWMLVGSVYRQADNADVPIPNLMPLYLIRKYHGESLKNFGDELSLHYHTFFWSDYDHDDVYYWNQSKTFHESRADWNWTLAQALIEEEVFPVSFRSGWHYMDNEWQANLNELLPFAMHNDYPHGNTDVMEPLQGVYDWTKSPGSWVPFHPSSTNYQVPGDTIGWNVRCAKYPNVTQAMVDALFTEAAGGKDQVVSFWAHLPESDFPANIARVDKMIQNASINKNAKFRYCTAIEAMQRWLGVTNETAPDLTIAEREELGTLTLDIQSSKPLFQPQPFVALKDTAGQYRIVPCVSNAPSAWAATMPVPRSDIVKIAVAATDPFGNLTTRFFSYLPGDTFIDNLDPHYTELSGKWASFTPPAWGTNARTAPLSEGEVAQAKWTLPVAQSGIYKLYAQAPLVTNQTPDVTFSLAADGAELFSNALVSPLPANRWVYLGMAALKTSAENVVTMTARGVGDKSVAVADVIKIEPVLNEGGFIQDVRVDAASSSANIIWSTPAPASSGVEYGLELDYGKQSRSNSLPIMDHVASLTDLLPGTVYYYQVHSSAGGTEHAWQSFFTTPPSDNASRKVQTPLLALTNTWKYSTQNLDGISWQAPAYDDSLWPEGPALLWVDTRATPNPEVAPKGTQIPANSETKMPYTAYYFRTHFNLTDVVSYGQLSLWLYLDDGAVIYLNGVEVQRMNMAQAPTIITNLSRAIGYNCPSGDATCGVLLNLAGDALKNLVVGDNVVSVEVHNYDPNSPDVTFGCSATFGYVPLQVPSPGLLRSGDLLNIYWQGTGSVLQSSNSLDPAAADWRDAPGEADLSPYLITNLSASAGARFYRLRSK